MIKLPKKGEDDSTKTPMMIVYCTIAYLMVVLILVLLSGEAHDAFK